MQQRVATWKVIGNEGGSNLDAIVAGCRECQTQRCDGSVGYGGSPDERTYEVGSVGSLRRVKDVIGVARAVMDYSQHTLLVGDAATRFAIEMGFKEENLSTNSSLQMWKDWENGRCQPNYRKNVSPDPRNNCGPYKPTSHSLKRQKSSEFVGKYNHDTIGMVVVDSRGNVAAGTSTNGLNHKIPGRVGDSPIVGAGAYAGNGLGGAAATGDGDIMMRFLPSFNAVMMLGQGMTPDVAAQKAIEPIVRYYPNFTGAIIVADTKGAFGAACHGLDKFHFSVASPSTGKVLVMETSCI
ncbi:hypothetical protein C0Q70_05961 [Pomacea canaliculata]|uniref:N(4)-(beta-N-acetylglucosaminyl)-L-asparaginase n=1 Tax=Pomacea canaliculata TaxID=400727 RepID=A0A2T7PMP5_POMCA|nr:hypothetical protein C0Q70_05961 [Pomacea canaliculata]